MHSTEVNKHLIKYNYYCYHYYITLSYNYLRNRLMEKWKGNLRFNLHFFNFQLVKIHTRITAKAVCSWFLLLSAITWQWGNGIETISRIGFRASSYWNTKTHWHIQIIRCLFTITHEDQFRKQLTVWMKCCNLRWCDTVDSPIYLCARWKTAVPLTISWGRGRQSRNGAITHMGDGQRCAETETRRDQWGPRHLTPSYQLYTS